MSEPIYDDDERLVSILTVMRDAGLFMEVIQPKITFDPESLDEQDPDEFLDKLASNADLDPEQFLFTESFRDDEGEYSVVRAGVINAKPEKEPSGHDWTEATTTRGYRLHTNMTGYSMCGKPLTECYDFNCIHKTIAFEHIWIIDERNEFRESATSLADRPTESFWFGLPGLRLTEAQDVTITRWLRWNKVCQNCRILTPSNMQLCQNCDRELVA